MASGEHTREYLTVKRNISDIVSSLAAQVDPGQFAQKLNQAGLVTSYVVEKASVLANPASNRIQDIIQAVLITISLDLSKYHIFIETLRTEYRPLADKLTQCYDSFANIEQPATKRSSQRKRDHGDTNEQLEDIPDMSYDFADMYNKIIPLLQKVVAVDKLKRFLRSLRHPQTGIAFVDPSLYQHLTTTEAILDALLDTCRIRPIDVGLLRAIVRSHGCDECKRLLYEYESKIPKYRRLMRSHNDLTDNEIDSCPCTKRLKVEIEGDRVTFSKVEMIQEGLEKSLGVSRDVIVYAKHEPGCVVLTFLVPETMVHAFTGIGESPESLSELAAMGVLSVIIEEVTIDVDAHLSLHKVEQHASSTESHHPSTGMQTPSTQGNLGIMPQGYRCSMVTSKHQSGQLAMASMSLSGLRSDGTTLAENAAELVKRMEAVEHYYIKKEQAISRRVGQLRDAEREHKQRKEDIEAELKVRKLQLSSQESSLREAQRDLDKARSQREEAESNKKGAIAAAVVTGVAGAALSILTFGVATPLAVGATAAVATAAVSYAEQEKRAESRMRDAREAISGTERQITSCNDRISRIKRDISELTQQIEELQLEGSSYHEQRGEIRHLIVFVKEAQTYWKQFAEATKHGARRAELVENLTKQAHKKSVFAFFTQKAGKREAMSFLEAWEKVQELAEGGSDHLFEMDFECCCCGHTFRSLPYADDEMGLVCKSCHFSD